MPVSGFSPLSDEQLVLLVRATGDPVAYGQLVERHQGSLRAFLTRHTGQPELAEDLAQDAFIRAFEHIGAFRSDASFKTWLFSIAHRELLQSIRRSGAFRRAIEGLMRFNPVEPVEHSFAGLDLQKGLASLTDVERSALLLADACGMSNSEVASTLGAPLGSVKTYIRRARQKMLSSMGEGYVE